MVGVGLGGHNEFRTVFEEVEFYLIVCLREGVSHFISIDVFIFVLDGGGRGG